jgi:hypothetical protein
VSTSKEWFRSADWSSDAEADFEARLARSRSWKRAQYLRIKALALLATGDGGSVETGLHLLRRSLLEAEGTLDASAALYALGDWLARYERSSEAQDALRACLAVEVEAGRRVSHGTELRLAEVLIARGRVPDREECWTLLDQAAAGLLLNDSRWRIEVARARLLARDGNELGAADHARRALDFLTTCVRAELPRHPAVGAIEATPEEIREMEALVALGTGSG